MRRSRMGLRLSIERGVSLSNCCEQFSEAGVGRLAWMHRRL